MLTPLHSSPRLVLLLLTATVVVGRHPLLLMTMDGVVTLEIVGEEGIWKHVVVLVVVVETMWCHN